MELSGVRIDADQCISKRKTYWFPVVCVREVRTLFELFGTVWHCSNSMPNGAHRHLKCSNMFKHMPNSGTCIRTVFEQHQTVRYVNVEVFEQHAKWRTSPTEVFEHVRTHAKQWDMCSNGVQTAPNGALCQCCSVRTACQTAHIAN